MSYKMVRTQNRLAPFANTEAQRISNYHFEPICDLLEPQVASCKKAHAAFKFFRDYCSERYEFQNPEVEHTTVDRLQFTDAAT